MINLGAEIFTKSQKSGVALTRPRRSGVNTGAKPTSTTTNEKSTDWGKRTILDIWQQYTRITEMCGTF